MTADYQARNAELLKQIRSGNEGAVAELMTQNASLVRVTVRRFLGRGVEEEDLLQIGMIGLLRAVRSYDFSYGTVFSTYAVPLIIGEIRKFLRDDGMVKVSRDTKRIAAEILKCKEELSRKLGRDPTVKEVEAASGYDSVTQEFAICATFPVRSLSEPIGTDTESNTLESILSDDGTGFEKLDEIISLRCALEHLEPVERSLVHLRYARDLSQVQTAKILGITQVKVSRMEKKIFDKIRGELKSGVS